MQKVHHAACPSVFRKSLPCASRAKTPPPNRRPLTVRQKRPITSPGAFVDMLGDLRQDFDSHGFADKELIAVGDGSFCNKTTFRQPLDRTILITRARKDLRLCFPHQGEGRRYYGTELFSSESVYKDSTIPWKCTPT